MVSPQSEQQLENALLKQLHSLGHSPVHIRDEKTLLSNLKSQLEKHNKLTFTDSEFKKVVNILNAGSVFERAKTLRGINMRSYFLRQLSIICFEQILKIIICALRNTICIVL